MDLNVHVSATEGPCSVGWEPSNRHCPIKDLDCKRRFVRKRALAGAFRRRLGAKHIAAWFVGRSSGFCVRQMCAPMAMAL